MEALFAFSIAFFFSFIGSIPPGTLNLTIIQLGLDDHHIHKAWRFALASAIVEYPYAWLAIEFESIITSSPVITENFQLISGVALIILGFLNLRLAKTPTKLYKRFSESGFRRGIILGILNPMALPFWIAMTAYMKSQGWIHLSTKTERYCYLLGVSLGVLVLLMVLAYTAKKVISQFQGNTFIKKVPGITMLALGAYAILQYIF